MSKDKIQLHANQLPHSTPLRQPDPIHWTVPAIPARRGCDTGTQWEHEAVSAVPLLTQLDPWGCWRQLCAAKINGAHVSTANFPAELGSPRRESSCSAMLELWLSPSCSPSHIGLARGQSSIWPMQHSPGSFLTLQLQLLSEWHIRIFKKLLMLQETHNPIRLPAAVSYTRMEILLGCHLENRAYCWGSLCLALQRFICLHSMWGSFRDSQQVQGSGNRLRVCGGRVCKLIICMCVCVQLNSACKHNCVCSWPAHRHCLCVYKCNDCFCMLGVSVHVFLCVFLGCTGVLPCVPADPVN